MLSVGLGRATQQDASWGLPRPAARRPGVKAICKAVHAPAKPTSHLPFWVLHYMAHGCPCGCDAAQDRLTSKHCRAFQCPCLVSRTDRRRSIFPWASSCWFLHKCFPQGTLRPLALAGRFACMCRCQGSWPQERAAQGPQASAKCKVCSGSSNNAMQARGRRAVSVVASEGSLGQSRTF